MKTEKQKAIELIASMRRNYGNKSEKFEIDREIKYQVKKHGITYEDMSDFHAKYKYDTIMKEWVLRAPKEFKSKLIGKYVNIKKNIESSIAGEWGVITYYDGDHYHVAPWGGPPELIFKRNEFKIPKVFFDGTTRHFQ